MTQMTRPSPQQVAQVLCPGMKMMYFNYVHEFHVLPRNIEEMIDGCLYLEAQSYSLQHRDDV